MKTTIRTIIVLLIVALAFASTANIHTRAGQLHADAGWQSWVISGGIAIIFALFAFALVISPTPAARSFFAFCTIFGAVLTSALQTGMYLMLGADLTTALSFGAGVPFLEALLAVSEHFLNTDHGHRRAAPSPVWTRLGNAIANRIEHAAQPGSATGAQPPQPPQPTELRRAELLRILSDVFAPEDINKAQLGRTLNASRQQIDKDIKHLVAAGRLSINGKVQVHQ